MGDRVVHNRSVVHRRLQELRDGGTLRTVRIPGHAACVPGLDYSTGELLRMHESKVTVVGNVATPLDHRTTGSGEPAVRFRLASTVRRFNRERGVWEDAWTSFFTVWAWRTLATNVATSLTLGEPVIVHGQLRVREDEREGRRHLSADLLASAVGHDLTRGTAAFERMSVARPDAAAPAAEAARAGMFPTDVSVHEFGPG